ncbi:MAG TPA: heparinase II/III family protein [Polyangiaceae bacterium]|nr:heparinase II/III family protein [Polyangiaceae bacterium]
MTGRPVYASRPAWVVGICVVAMLACTRYAVHRLSGDRRATAPAVHAPDKDLGAARLVPKALGRGDRRLLLDADAVARLAESARRKTEAYETVLARADEVLATPVASGYQGFAWTDAMADTSLVWLATGDERYGRSAVRYLNALLDDRFGVGDGKGGQDVVTHDSGYGMRTFGAYAALGYDWLRDAPGMDRALKAHVLERLDQWLSWYAAHGYLRDHPIANYYWGYLTTLSFAGLAAAGDSSAADGWLAQAHDALSKAVLPTFRDDLAGGGWPEGWQYGEYTAAEVALVGRAFRTAAGVDVAGRLPWLSQTVTYHVHALLPDEQSVYDGGTWSEHPARPSALALTAAAIALDGVDDERAAEARWMLAHALPRLRREQAWMALLADRPGATERDPRARAPVSLHLPVQGLTFARSAWTRYAVWTSFQAGPPLAEDHQDADQGHFELFRGPDGLLVDGGDSEGSATINHNTLLVDDGGRVQNYPPNQGVWGATVRTTRFGDDGAVAVAVGDIGEAYAPSCAADGCTKRSVRRMVRTFVFVRPALLVVDDRVTLDRPDYDVTWAAHVTTPPTIAGGLATAVVGRSRVDLRTLEPEGAEAVALREPTPSGEGSHRADRPWGPMWRIEVSSRRGKVDRSFLHFITADRADAQPPPARRLAGDGLHGGEGGDVDGRRVAVLFADSKDGGSATIGAGDALVVVAGLEPGARYAPTWSGCRLEVTPTRDPTAPVASPGGFVRLTPAPCRAP